MHDTNTTELYIDNFCLKVSVLGRGPIAIVIGSHNYYPRTFSENLIKSLQLIYIDTRGFTRYNEDQKEYDFKLDKIIQDIENIRRILGLNEKVIIIGHSIHALMAIEYAKKFPDCVSHVCLIASSPIMGPEIYKEADQYFEESVCPERKAAFKISIQNFAQSKNQSFIARMLAFGPRLWYNVNFDASYLWENVEINTLGSNIIWGSIFTDYDTVASLKAIKCPIFLALGRYDYFNPPHLWETYRQYCRDLTIRIFEQSGHTPQLEEQNNFDTELLKWLKKKKINR